MQLHGKMVRTTAPCLWVPLRLLWYLWVCLFFILLSLTCILCLFCVIKTNIIFSIQKCQVDADVYQNKIKKSPQSAMGVYKQKIN